jgi:hypothetical protein
MSETIRQVINRLGVPKTTVATLADISCQELSLFFRDPSQVSAIKQDRIRKTVEEIRQFLDEVWPEVQTRIPFPFPLDLKNATALRTMLDYVRNLPAEQQAESEAVTKIQNMFDALGAER